MPPTTATNPLQIAHRVVLVAIAVCVGLSALQLAASEEPSPDPTTAAIAFGLGIGVILLRRSATSPVISETTRLYLGICTYACAFSLAALGLYLAMSFAQARTGLTFGLGAGLLCVRPLAPTARSAARR